MTTNFASGAQETLPGIRKAVDARESEAISIPYDMKNFYIIQLQSGREQCHAPEKILLKHIETNEVCRIVPFKNIGVDFLGIRKKFVQQQDS